MNVLIVEDERPVRELIVRAVAPHSSEIKEAETLWEAFDLCRSLSRIDIIVLDLILPDSDGPTTAKQIVNFKELHPEAAILVITGLGDSEEIKKICLDNGADVFASKDQSILQRTTLLTLFLQAIESRKKSNPECPDFVHNVNALRQVLTGIHS